MQRKKECTLLQKSIFLSHAELPSKLYVGQIFSLKVKATVTNSRFDDIKVTLFNESASAEILNPDAKWQPLGNSSYENTFYFKLKSPSVKLLFTCNASFSRTKC